MANRYKPTITERVLIPSPGFGAFNKRNRIVMPEVLTLKVRQSVAYPVKNKADVGRLSRNLQNKKSNDRDFTYRTVQENGKVFFRVWRTV